MSVKGFVEGGIASIIAGCSTHPLDLIKVRMQLQGESSTVLRPTLAFDNGGATTSAHLNIPRVGPIGVGMKIIQVVRVVMDTN